MNQTVTATGMLQKGWEIFMANASAMLGLILLPMVPVFLGGIVATLVGASFEEISTAKGPNPTVFTSIAITAIFSLYLYLRTYAGTLLSLYDYIRTGKKFTFSQGLARGGGNTGKMLVIVLITSLIVVLGFIALIIPGILFFLWFYLAPIIYLAEGGTVSQALQRSKNLLKGNYGAVLVFFLIIFIISMILNFIPVINIISGFIIGIVAQGATVYLYATLSQQANQPQAK